MTKHRRKRSTTLTTGLLLLLTSHVVSASEERDWPCEQVYVPEVSAAVVWDGPNIDGVLDQWRQQADVEALVRQLTARRAAAADAEPAIEAFAKQQPPAERNGKLTLLFAGVWQSLNADRRKLNNGILRYARDQQQRAEKLDAHLVEMVRLENDPSAQAGEKLSALRKQVDIEQRVFDDRERTIPFLCTRPRVLEQKLGELARSIAYQLE